MENCKNPVPSRTSPLPSGVYQKRHLQRGVPSPVAPLGYTFLSRNTRDEGFTPSFCAAVFSSCFFASRQASLYRITGGKSTALGKGPNVKRVHIRIS